MRCVLAVVLLFAVGFVSCQLGTITVTFNTNNAPGGNDLGVDAVLSLGDTIEATVTLSPAPTVPIRLDITSTVPNIIKVSHATLTFNRNETTGKIILESPEDGRIGISTIIIKPEKLGFYKPVTFDLLVQGSSEVALVDSIECVAAGVPVEFVVKLFPPALEEVVVSLTATNGVLSNNTVVIPTGRTAAVFTFTGTAPGPSTISATTDFYTFSTVSFNTLGRIDTDSRSQLIEGAPEYVNVTVFPPLTGNNTVLVNVTGGNAVVSDSSIEVGANGTQIEIVPTFFGFSNVTYTAEGYCPTSDFYTVAEAPICSQNSATNILGDQCLVCPGNIAGENQINNCNGNGLCRYTHCFDDEVTCLCNSSYVGFACQWQVELQANEFVSAVLNSEPFDLAIELPHMSELTEFSAPGNLVNESLQPGLAILAPYPFFGAINPALVPPPGAEYTGDSFSWENTCYENAYINDNFTAPVTVKFSLDFGFLTEEEMLQLHLCLWNSTASRWVDAEVACAGAKLNVSRAIDLYSYTFTTGFCQPGQYALFVLPISSPVPNTGNSNNPHPLPSQLADAVFAVSSGWQPAPPLPLPNDVNAPTFDPSPPQMIHAFASANSGSALVVSIFLCLCVVLLHL